MRTYDLDHILKAVSLYAPALEAFPGEEWVEREGNVALTNEYGDVALFERHEEVDTIAYTHCFFFSRGKRAVEVGREFLKEIFQGPYGIEILLGFTPTDHKAALWMNRRMGFRALERLPIGDRTYELVLLTKPEWEKKQQ